MKVSATVAADLVDRNERIVRRRIERGELSAQKDGQTWQIDVADLESIPGWKVSPQRLQQIKQKEIKEADGLFARIEGLERSIRGLQIENQELRRRIHSLESKTSMNTPEMVLEAPQSDGKAADNILSPSPFSASDFNPTASYTPHTPTYQPTVGMRRPLPPTRGKIQPVEHIDPGVPEGFIALVHFAQQHAVNGRTARDQATQGRFNATLRPIRARPGHNEWFLNPEQQMQAIAFWADYSATYQPCPECPHTVETNQSDE